MGHEPNTGAWHKTGCVLCAQNCGLEVLVRDDRIVRSRPDRDNPRSQGYVCRKGLNVAFHQHHAERLTQPLKRVGDGFQPIAWNRALDEIAERLREIVGRYGPRSLAYVGGGGQGCHLEATFGMRLLRGMGSQYFYGPLGQELTGLYWVQGRATGRQYLHTIPDQERTELLLAVGWNGWMSHQMPQARRVLNRISKDPEKLLVVIDPRYSETAARADIHLSLRPGTDALLTRAMIKIILDNGWEAEDYLETWVSGWAEARGLFRGFDDRAAVKVCGLDYAQVQEVCRLLTTKRWSMHPDLGVLMSRHSTATSYLEHVLLCVCGRIGKEGGNVLPGHLMPLGSHSDERDERTWRTGVTGFPAILGNFPPNVMPQEILTDHPERLRAVLVSGSNPLRSYADTRAYEEAFGKLDLLVTTELALTETAALSDYVLPARSGYESWDGTFFAWTYPEVFFQMRRPVVEPEGEPKEVGQVYTLLADRLGLIPDIPKGVREAAQKDRAALGTALMSWFKEEPRAKAALPFILAQTLGQELGSANLAALWGMLMTSPKSFRENAARAGFGPGPGQGEEIFQALLDNPQGVVIGRCDEENNLAGLKTADGRLNVYVPEMEDWVSSIEPESEEEGLRLPEEFPLVLNAGRHMDLNANTLMRDPAWNKGRRACTLAMNPDQAQALGLADGTKVRVVTEAGRAELELERDPSVREGMVIIPHGFGLDYEGRVYGVNVNRLTGSGHRDRLAGTPLHRYVPCRVEPVSGS